MKKSIQTFEQILSDSQLLDSEMEALRGGAEGSKIQCVGGLVARCEMGVYEVTEPDQP